MKITKEFAKKFYDNGSHGWGHISRVYVNALKISETEDCDLEVIKVAALLHDIARYMDEDNIKSDHAKEGAKKVKELLEDFDYTSTQKDNIVYCIKVHRYSHGIKPETIEAAILQDADRLDALGAIIISRLFFNTGKKNGIIHNPEIKVRDEYKGGGDITTPINHFYEKLLKITPNSFNTKKGKELAKSRYDFTKNFLEQFLKEWECEI